MSISSDEIMSRLSSADPVDGQRMPKAEDDSAQALLNRVISSNGYDNGTGPAVGTDIEELKADPPTTMSRPSESERPLIVGRKTSRTSRNNRVMLAVAAAAVFLVGSALVFSPSNTPTAVAAVRDAAATTADVDSARITTTFTFGSTNGSEVESFAGQIDGAYAGDDFSFTFETDLIEGPDLDNEMPVDEVRLVDNMIYVDVEGEWLGSDTNGLLGGVVSDYLDPRIVLEEVQKLTETSEIGSVDIDGMETAHYQSVVDLGGDESLAQSGWLPSEVVDVDVDGELTVDLFVAADGTLRQLDLSGDVEEPDGGTESGTFAVSTKYYDFGAVDTIEAPIGFELLDPFNESVLDE